MPSGRYGTQWYSNATNPYMEIIMVKVNKETRTLSINLPSYKEFEQNVKAVLPTNKEQVKRTAVLGVGGMACIAICNASEIAIMGVLGDVVGLTGIATSLYLNYKENKKEESK